jgi:hypothetical protein
MKRLKPDERLAITDWDAFKKGILEATIVDDTETEAEKKKRIERLEKDDEAWFAYYFPTYYTCKPAKFHVKATRRLMDNARWYEVRAWSRELAKTARAMMEVTKLALTGKIKNVLLVSNSSDNAERLLMPVMLNLEFNQRIINDYGPQKRLGAWEIGEFTTIGGVSFRALGAGQSPRGTRNEAFRPDFIWIDDFDTDEECLNPDRIKKKWDWIEQALIPTVSVSGNYRILFNGNIIARDCCITRAIKKANHADVINIRDKNGASTWPEKNSEADIDNILSIVSTASAQKEYFNNPVSVGEIFKEMKWGAVPALSRFTFLVVYGDPAPSNRTNGKGSFKSIFLMGYLDSRYYIFTGYLDHVTNADFVDWYYQLRKWVNDKTIVYNCLESNGFQNPFFEQVFAPLFAEAAKKHGSPIGIIQDDREKPDKFSRIEGNLEPINRNGLLIFNEAERGNPNMLRLEEQFLLVNPRLSAPADGPDCIEGGKWIIDQKNATLAPDSIKIGYKTRNNKKSF